MTLTNFRRLDGDAESGGHYLGFNRPAVVGRELHYVASTITHSNISGGGMYTQACEAFIEKEFDVGSALLVTSCTSALEMAAMLCDLDVGDEVIMPSFTFVSTAEAVVRAGATPVFVDIRPDTLNLDEARLEQAITSRTKAIWPIHYAGVAAEMNVIMDIARANDLLVVEDAAQGVGATYDGRALGSLAHLGTYSFHETKNFSCGEGGALCVNEPRLVERAEIIRDKGTNRKQFQRGTADKYTWVDHGSSYVLSEILAAFLYGQLEQTDLLSSHRETLWNRYDEILRASLENAGVSVPTVPPGRTHNHHIYYLVTENRHQRDALIAWLAADEIQAVFHYVPLHSSPMGIKVGRAEGSMVNTDVAGDCLVRLPLHHELTVEQVDRIAEAVIAFYRTAPA
ncbi:MAG: dTDP-4-amino-4,6-dideoxygalactose transaminase [Acidimicrobiales bacterium]